LKVQRGLVRKGLETKNGQIFEIHVLNCAKATKVARLSKAKTTIYSVALLLQAQLIGEEP
jgi:hypothetical protein